MARTVFGNKTNRSNPTPGMGGGTMGGRKSPIGGRPGSRSIQVGDEMYLWLLVIIEVATMGYLRHHFRRHHGG